MRPGGVLAAVAALLMLAPGAATAQEQAASGTGAILRGLDKVNGQSVDLDLSNGSAQRLGRLIVELNECRYPAHDAAGDAYAFLTIREEGNGVPVFAGWMVASSPALNALEHPRYDVWVLRCKTE